MRNTSRIGEVCVANVLCALVNQGKHIWLPFGDSGRSDLMIEEDDGRVLRVQCKNARLIKGAITFHACSVDSRSVKGKCIRKLYGGQVDYFGVFCPDTGKCYLVPIKDVPGIQCFLRVDPPRNNQKTGIRWARDYEIRATTGRRKRIEFVGHGFA